MIRRNLPLLCRIAIVLNLALAAVGAAAEDRTGLPGGPPRPATVSGEGLMDNPHTNTTPEAPLKQCFYVDPVHGHETSDGLSPATAWRTWANFPGKASPGSALLLRRGLTYTLPLPLVGGRPGAPIVYGAYGEGARPILQSPVINLSATGQWVRIENAVWRSLKDVPEVANVVCDDKVCGNKRYVRAAMTATGDYFQAEDGRGPVFLRSAANPGETWHRIEVVSAGRGVEVRQSHVRFEHLHLRKIGGNGIWIKGSQDVTIRACELSLIGGELFRVNDNFLRSYGEQFVKRRVRFGNAIELWDAGSDLVIEACRVHDIFDGGICIQGFKGASARSIQIRNNVIWDCGYDSFDVAHGIRVLDLVFENNTCWNGGEGWALQGEPRPRWSVLVPDNIGYHFNLEDSFGWDPECRITARKNIFCNAPSSRCFNYGPKQPSQLITIDSNCYFQAEANGILAQIGKQAFTAALFKEYQAQSGWDRNSIVADPRFLAPNAGDFRLALDSPCRGYGAQTIEALAPEAASAAGKPAMSADGGSAVTPTR